MSSKSKLPSSSRKRRKEEEVVQEIKHYDSFYGQAPPGLVKEEKEHPEDSIPDLPQNREAREFLAAAPSKGLWMPLGKEVKVMQCWRCKAYGHRTGDRECPMFIGGNKQNEKFRYMHEDPMHNFISKTKREEQETRIQQLQALLDAPTSSDSDSSTSRSSLDSDSPKKKRHKSSSRSHKKKHKKKAKKRSKK